MEASGGDLSFVVKIKEHSQMNSRAILADSGHHRPQRKQVDEMRRYRLHSGETMDWKETKLRQKEYACVHNLFLRNLDFRPHLSTFISPNSFRNSLHWISLKTFCWALLHLFLLHVVFLGLQKYQWPQCKISVNSHPMQNISELPPSAKHQWTPSQWKISVNPLPIQNISEPPLNAKYQQAPNANSEPLPMQNISEPPMKFVSDPPMQNVPPPNINCRNNCGCDGQHQKCTWFLMVCPFAGVYDETLLYLVFSF